MPKLDFDLERDVPVLTGKVLLITGGDLPPCDASHRVHPLSHHSL